LVTATLCRATGKKRDVSQIKLNGICGLTLKPLIGRTVEGFLFFNYTRYPQKRKNKSNVKNWLS
jgi:hypothetical protein